MTGYIITAIATSTHRCAHRNPNLAQVPSDPRFRELFVPSKGMVMVGADLSGIELRMLSHYLARFDGGRYADILLNGDIHQVNADKIGISRKQVKTVTYAFSTVQVTKRLVIHLTRNYHRPMPNERERKSVAHTFLRLTDWYDLTCRC